MNKEGPSNKGGKVGWKLAYDRTVISMRKIRPSVRTEWRKFSPEKIDLLLTIVDPETDETAMSTAILTASNREMFLSDIKFLVQCFLVCLEDNLTPSGKFFLFYTFVEKAVDERRLWPVIFPALFQHAMDLDWSNTLSQLLDLAHHNNSSHHHPKIDTPPSLNDPSLLLACEKDDGYETVRLFVNHGYRLRSRLLSQARKHREEEKTVKTAWKEYAEIPKFIHRRNMTMTVEENDEVHDLHLLRMMAKPAYILSCYSAVADTFDFDNTVERSVCDCFISARRKMDKPDGTGEPQHNGNAPGCVVSARTEHDTDFHYCPSHDKFLPHPECRKHLECNDPIFRCFDLTRVASDNAARIPEYRAEFSEVAELSCGLSVMLLESCQNTEEVETLLSESAGSEKYFRHARYLKYPRMRLAIEHNHKDFAGHMFCQQILRQEWLGRVNWHGKHFLYKTLYFVLQMVTSPLHIAHFCYIHVGRDIKMHYYCGTLPSTVPDTKIKTFFHRYLDYTNSIVINLDVPINRYLTYTGYYMTFMWLIFIAVLLPVSEQVSEDPHEFPWFYWCLLLFSVSMLSQDLLLLMHRKSTRTFFKFWRVYDLVLHVTLFASLVLRLTMVHVYPCVDDPGGEVVLCDSSFVVARTEMDTICSCFFSMASTFAMLRVTYWFQLNDRIGPVIINLSRVMLDIITMIGIYVLVVVAFSCGFVFILTADHYVATDGNDDGNNANLTYSINDTLELSYEFAGNLTDIAQVLFWAILNPGPSDIFKTHDGARGGMSSVMFAFYEILCAIVFLNLLIATMNATVQRMQGSRDLYWKYTRASIWIEFFDSSASLPPPFTVIALGWSVVLSTFLLVKRCCEKRNKGQGKVPVACRTAREDHERRRRHAVLMLKLVERYLKQSRLGVVGEERKIKKDEVNHRVAEKVRRTISTHM